MHPQGQSKNNHKMDQNQLKIDQNHWNHQKAVGISHSSIHAMLPTLLHL